MGSRRRPTDRPCYYAPDNSVADRIRTHEFLAFADGLHERMAVAQIPAG